jgi:hypothetical protein
MLQLPVTRTEMDETAAVQFFPFYMSTVNW